MMPIRPFYLGENPSSPSHFRPQSMSQANLSSPTQRSATSSPTQQKHAINRQSMPPQRVSAASPPASAPPSARKIPEEVEPASGDEGDGSEDQPGRARKGTMSKNFRFPPHNPAQPPPPVPALPPTETPATPADKENASDAKAKGALKDVDSDMTNVAVVTPSSVEVPPPPPVEKERPLGSANDLDDDVGETEEISLN